MRFTLLVCLMFASFTSYAGLNKWVDAEGKVHYSDTPPTDAKSNKLRTYTAPDAAASGTGEPASKTLAEKEADWKKSQKSKEEAEKNAANEKENAAIKQKNCESSRQNLATLENSPSIVTYDAKGERSFMDDESRKRSTADARKAVSEFCK